ncbi:DUF4115 domain-containing protein [Acetobacteraceae bacterium KSS8]|uniref:DUF4115 domain-containing protein n=1 Tax=Endosaccharibacter trunci TaxID=2812733 RepID=A0ABT1W6R1_9PROT|nr:DUF4115 domain-containing protein [Acetobacteraceae bacterium KSS8]
MASGGDQTGTEIPTDISRLPVGDALRTRREQLGWTLPDVAAWLRIRQSYLEALEAGQPGKIPGGAYAMAFLRTYSGALGLDADDMLRRFRGETKEVTRKPELSFPVPVPERGVPAGAIVLLGVVMVVGAYVGWYELGGRSTHEAHSVPPVPEALSPYVNSNGRGPSPQVATVMPGPGQVPSPLPPAATGTPADAAAQKPAANPETAGVAADMPKVAPSPAPGSAAQSSNGVASDATRPGAAPASVPTTGLSSGAATSTPAPTPAASDGADPSTVTLNAISNSWVQVRQPGGKVIYDHVMQAGEHWSVPADAGAVVLNTGNAGGLTVSAGGVTSPVLGRVGGVRRGIPLTVEAVKSGEIASGADKSAKPAAPDAASSSGATGSVTATPAGGSVDSVRTAPHAGPVQHRPAQPPAEDETERLNQAQLKQSVPPQ